MENKSANILVVDDDPILLDLLAETLDSIGYETVRASGGVEALEQLEARPFDLLITDIQMPEVDGPQLVKKVRQLYPALPVLYITGHSDPEEVGDSRADGFLLKPFRISKIEELIETTLINGRQT